MNSESYSFGGAALRRLLACAALAAASTSCEAAPEAHVPMFGDGGMLRLGTPLTRDQLYKFEGMFDLSQGSDLLGSDASVRTSNGTVSILTDKDAGYVVLGAACLPDQRVVLEGYWQYPTRVKAGLVRLFVDPPELALALCNGEEPDPTTELQLSGSYGNGDQYPTMPLALGWARDLKPWRGRFFTTAHHGACEATDHCGVSQNSVESLRLADRIGSNAVEIDVRTTREGIPVLFHDPQLSAALVDGLFCNGKIAELSLPELRANCTLRHGETIPTVGEVLDSLINDTEIEGVYLDMKVPEAVLPAARLVAAAQADMQARNENDDPNDDRRMGIVIAITKDEVLQAWHDAQITFEAEGLAMPPCLLEYDPNLVLSENCVAWGPTWTQGPQVANVNKVRAAGAITVFWTINQTDFINEFLTRAHPNGIISARSALLFHRYQKIGTPPPLPGETE